MEHKGMMELDNQEANLVIGQVPRIGRQTLIHIHPSIEKAFADIGAGSDNSKINALIDYALHKLHQDQIRLIIDVNKRYPREKN